MTTKSREKPCFARLEVSCSEETTRLARTADTAELLVGKTQREHKTDLRCERPLALSRRRAEESARRPAWRNSYFLRRTRRRAQFLRRVTWASDEPRVEETRNEGRKSLAQFSLCSLKLRSGKSSEGIVFFADARKLRAILFGRRRVRSHGMLGGLTEQQVEIVSNCFCFSFSFSIFAFLLLFGALLLLAVPLSAGVRRR